jgi:hypothetical protein
MIRYKFIYEETDDDADPDIADIATKHIQITVSGKDDKTYPELLVHFKEWLSAIGFGMEGITFEAIEK